MKLRAKAKKNQVVNEESTTRLSCEEIAERIASVEATLKARTWCDLEIHGKFGKEQKISFISDDMLIVGCDIGSESHFIRAIDTRGRELSRDAFEFSNSSEGFELAKAWMLERFVWWAPTKRQSIAHLNYCSKTKTNTRR